MKEKDKCEIYKWLLFATIISIIAIITLALS